MLGFVSRYTPGGSRARCLFRRHDLRRAHANPVAAPVLTHVRVGSVAVTRGAWHHSRVAARPQLRPPDPARKRSGMEAEQPSSSPAPSPKLSLTALASAAEKAGVCPQRLVLDLAALTGIRSPTKTQSCRHSGSKLVPQPSWRNRRGISESGASDDRRVRPPFLPRCPLPGGVIEIAPATDDRRAAEGANRQGSRDGRQPPG